MVDEEIWKPIPNFSGYEASNLGRIRTHNKVTYTKRHGDRHWKDRIMKPKIEKRVKGNNRDYRVILWQNGKPITKLVSRCVISAFYGESNLQVNHIDGNSLNNNLTNLEYCTAKENINHGFDNGLIQINKKTIIKIKSTGEEILFRSMANASEFIGHNHGYISRCILKHKYSNELYEWRLS